MMTYALAQIPELVQIFSYKITVRNVVIMRNALIPVCEVSACNDSFVICYYETDICGRNGAGADS
jgi:hypothetical protein